SRPDEAVQMLGSGGKHQKQLRIRVHGFLMLAQQHLADPFGYRGSPGLPGDQWRTAALGQRLGENAEIGGLARPLGAFEGDEQSAHGVSPLALLSAGGGLER